MRKRRLTPEERRLWRRAMGDTRPLKKASSEAGDLGLSSGDKKAHASKAGGHGAEKATLKERKAMRPSSDPFASGDPKMDRHARKGRMAVDGVFDLHGHTQASARAALYGFILRARSSGWRCVLVITGKGARSAAPDGIESRRCGILRERFREWLSEHDFRQHIVRASPAHGRHGGDGAFYVFLKRIKG